MGSGQLVHLGWQGTEKTHHDGGVRIAQYVEADLVQLLPEVVAVLAQLGQLAGAAAGAVCVLNQLQRRNDLLHRRRRHGSRIQLRRADRSQGLHHAPAGRQRCAHNRHRC